MDSPELYFVAVMQAGSVALFRRTVGAAWLVTHVPGP